MRSTSKYLAFRIAAAILARLPLRACYALATSIGDLAYFLNRGARDNVRDNMRHVLGSRATPRTVEHASRSVFRNATYYYVDLLRMHLIEPIRFDRDRVIDRGIENLHAAASEGRGCVIISAHYGNPELAIQALLARGYPVFALTEPLEPPALSRFLDERRSAAGHRFRAATYAALKEAMRTLRAGSNIALMFDRDIRGRSITIDLCGAPAQVPVGAVEFALRTGAPIVPVFIHRRVDQRFDVWIEPALHVGDAGDREARVRETVRELFRRFEAHLRCDPGQWMVLERIWDAPG